MSSPRVTLSPNSAIPLTGLGLWKVPVDAAADTVYTAIKAGYRLLDGAADYANEQACGEGVKRALEEGIVTREELFIVSKLWNTDHAQEHVEPAIRRSLADWGVDYFDLYLVHFPISLAYVDPAVRYPPGWTTSGEPLGTPGAEIAVERSPMHLTWAGMEGVHALGLARNIGVSNFAGALLMDLLSYARVKPAVLQVEMHPFHAQQGIIDLCRASGIHLMAFCSFGPQSWIELSDPRVDLLPSLFSVPAATTAATAHGVSPAQVLLRWATQRGITVIPKSLNAGRLAENLANTTFDLTSDEIAAISALDRGFRFNQPAGIDPRISIFA